MSEGKAHVLGDVIEHKLCTEARSARCNTNERGGCIPVGLVPVPVELGPCRLVACGAKDRGVSRAMLAGRDLPGFGLAMDIHEIDL